MWQHIVDWFHQNLIVREEGQGMAEYALILFLVSIVAAATLTPMGTTIAGLFTAITAAL